jgi:hypothetical protein
MERLVELEIGNPVPRPVVAVPTSPFQHPDAQRRFRIVDRHDELRLALEFPWDRWIVFLHPSQRQIAEKNLKGWANLEEMAQRLSR